MEKGKPLRELFYAMQRGNMLVEFTLLRMCLAMEEPVEYSIIPIWDPIVARLRG